ncbi:MAG: bifunctional DNA-formamidopyrimidine glycosylase/DNA-(apurinic or apyrimidinic site) lyase [Pseudomonadota bacterium]
MPELPEVETTRRGVEPHCLGRKVQRVIVRDPRLRWPVPGDLAAHLEGQQIRGVDRRAKYLLFQTARGTLQVHLGMSGSLRVVMPGEELQSHDHIDLVMEGSTILRYNDPRRFGSFHWLMPGEPRPLLDHLGPEPLSDDFDGHYLYRLSRGRRVAVKSFIMDAKVVVGVGNIYANEALFHAGIHPGRPAGRVAEGRFEGLAEQIKLVLTTAIDQGGTTLRDFVGGDGRPGYFAQKLFVYGRGGETCKRCERALKEVRIGQRSTVYCVTCQR